MISPRGVVPALGWAGLVLLLLMALPGRAGQDDGWARALELPAHEALLAVRARPGTRLSRFRSDGCSGGLSEAWRLVAGRFPGFALVHESLPPWESCCVTHDRSYHDGAAAADAGASYGARLAADRRLEACVIDMGRDRRDELAGVYAIRPGQVQAAYALIGAAMFRAVRLGGAPCTGLPWRWGFGYPGCSVFGGAGDRGGAEGRGGAGGRGDPDSR